MNTAIRNATPDHELARATSDAARAPWSTLESLVASLIDELRQFEWMYASAHAKTAPKMPEPIRRPGITARRHGKKLMRISEIRTLDPRMRDMSDDEIRELINSPAMREGELCLGKPKLVL